MRRACCSSFGLGHRVGWSLSGFFLVAAVVTVVPAAPVSAGHDNAPVVLASGWSPSDTAVAAALAVAVEGRVLHSYRDRLGASAAAALGLLDPPTVYVVGGPAAVPEVVLAEVAAQSAGVRIERLGGADRVGTAVAAVNAVSRRVGGPVVIASGWSPSDGSVAAAVAAGLGGTVLHSYPSRLGDANAEVLEALAPGRVLIIGDSAAVPDIVRAEAATVVGGARIERVSGRDRTETAAQAAGVRSVGRPVVLASGWSAPDASAAAALAAAVDGSVLLVRFGDLGAAAAVLQRLQPSEVFMVGGPAAISEAVAKEVRRLRGGAGVVRIFGADRVETASEVAKYTHGRSRDGSGAEGPALPVYDEPLFDPFTEPTLSGIDLGRLGSAVGTVTAGQVDCGSVPPLDVAGVRVVPAPGDINDPGADLSVAEVARIAGGCLLVEYVALGDLTVSDVRDLLADEPSVHAVGEPPRGVRPALAQAGSSGWDENKGDSVAAQWHLTPDITGADGNLLALWSRWDTANPVTVAVLDSGVDVTHADLDDQVHASTLDECHRTDQSGHGTHVAGIVAAEADGSLVAGVAPDAKILPIRVLYRDTCPSGTGDALTITRAIAEAVNSGARVINMSLISKSKERLDADVDVGGINISRRADDPLELAVRAASMLGVVLVAAVGNCGSDKTSGDPPVPNWKRNGCSGHHYRHAPGVYPDVIAVASVDEGGDLAPSSSRTRDVEIAAPGVAIISTLPVHDKHTITPAGGTPYTTCTTLEPSLRCTVGKLGGTSMASPYVAGIVAHMLNRFPDADLGAVRHSLQTSALAPRPDHDGVGYGWGIADPIGALAALGRLTNDLVPTPAGNVNRYVSVSASGENTCALRANGAVDCWGDNRNGRSAPPDLRFRSISASRDISEPNTGGHVCGLVDDGRFTADARGLARCWGSETTTTTTNSAARGTFTQVTAGRTYSCGLRPDSEAREAGKQRSGGHAVCWDHLPAGQTFSDKRSTPPHDELFVHLSAGWHHGCGATADSLVECWGSNDDGQADPPLLVGVGQVASGRFHSCALLSDSTVTCWGESRRSVRELTGASEAPNGRFAEISAHRDITCGLTTDAHVLCWGDDTYGQVSAAPQDDGYLSISAGDDHACAVKSSGTNASGVPVGYVVCWGRDHLGQSAPRIAGKLTHLSIVCPSACSRSGRLPISGFDPYTYTYRARLTSPQPYVTVAAVSMPDQAPPSTPTIEPPDSRPHIRGHQIDTAPDSTTVITVIVPHPYDSTVTSTDRTNKHRPRRYTIYLRPPT